jgi:peptidoglycan-associated lipoprotein
MSRLTKVCFIALAAVLASVTGCKTGPKNLTPLPTAGYAATNITTSTSYQPPVQDPGLRPQIPPRRGSGLGDGTQVTPQDLTSRPVTDPTRTIVETPTTPLPTGPRQGILDGDRETLRAQTVYFDYDKSAIKSSEKVKVAAVSEYLKSHPDQTLLVEGNCDERGTEEYNRALGERRALSVREMLVNLGTPADKITTVSFGKDKPFDTGHDESAWSKNRRGEFVLLPAAGAVR